MTQINIFLFIEKTFLLIRFVLMGLLPPLKTSNSLPGIPEKLHSLQASSKKQGRIDLKNINASKNYMYITNLFSVFFSADYYDITESCR